jgi:sigma-E factor negative regulatory protein RseC
MENHKVNNNQANAKNAIQHDGFITKITDQTVTVSLTGNLNCDACNAKMVCGSAESGDKVVEVLNTHSGLQLNDSVNVLLRKDLGMKAVFWAYVFPFILLMTVLVTASFFLTEWIAGVLSILVLLPYYLLLYSLKKVFDKSFQFSILKTM